jgi:hypothetical protein
VDIANLDTTNKFCSLKAMNTIYRVITLIFSLTILAGATQQVSDALIIRGKIIYTHDMPGLKKAFPKLNVPEFEITSTANYKGYSASWAVIEDQLYLVGLEAMPKNDGEMLWDEKILKGQKFPVKVEEWSGEVTRSSPVSSFDPNTGKSERYDKVTTIVFVKGMVTKVDFDRKVPRKDDAGDESK